MKLINSFLFIIYCRMNSVRCSFLSYCENVKHIRIGKKTKVDALATLKGGRSTDSYLIIGNSVRIHRNCYISATEGNIDIDDDVLIAHNTWIAGHGITKIGSNTLIGPNVVIVSSNHDLNSSLYPAMLAPEIRGTVIIGKNCWIGANTTIVPDVEIGEGCIVGGGSVVTENVPSNSLVAGNPARTIKKLDLKLDGPYKMVNK